MHDQVWNCRKRRSEFDHGRVDEGSALYTETLILISALQGRTVVALAAGITPLALRRSVMPQGRTVVVFHILIRYLTTVFEGSEPRLHFIEL